MKSSTKSGFPSTAELANDSKISFVDAGKDYPEIKLLNEEEVENEIDQLLSQINENSEWMDFVKAVKRCISLVNGGIFAFDNFNSRITELIPGIVYGISSTRSAVVKSTCLFVSLLAQKLRSKITILGNLIQPLSKQTSHQNLIVTQSCKLTIIEIAKNCPKSQILKMIIELIKTSSSANNTILSECLVEILNLWPESIISNNFKLIEKTMNKLINDPVTETRMNTRTAIKIFITKFEEEGKNYLETFDKSSQKAIRDTMLPKIESSEQQPSEKEEIVFKPEKSSKTKEKRKNVSNIPRKAKKSDLACIKGSEESFISQVEQSNKSQIEKHINSVVKGLMRCLTASEGKYTDRSLMLIYNLIQEFPTNFESHLEVLFQTFFGIIGDNELVRSILTIITDSFDTNLLIDFCAAQLPSSFLLSYIAEIVGLQGDQFSNREADQKLLSIAERQFRNHEAEATKIVNFIAEKNPLIIKEFSKSCNEDFLNLIKENIPDNDTEIANLENDCEFNDWSETVMSVAKSLSDDEWEEKKTEIFEKIINAIDVVEYKESVFDLLFNILDIKGVSGFEMLLRPIFLSPGFRRSVSCRKILSLIEDSLEPSDVAELFTSPLEGEDKQFAAACVNEIAFLAVNYDDLLRDECGNITQKLCDFISDQSIVIRKSVVVCIATLISSYGAPAEKITKKLPEQKRKLIEIYKK